MTRVQRTGTVQADLPATPEQVWQVLTDVPRIGEWSHECHTAKWLDGADQAAVGARFRGTSKARFARWSRPCTITALDTDQCFTYRTNGGIQRDARHTPELTTQQHNGSERQVADLVSSTVVSK